MQEITSRFDAWGGFIVSSMIEPEVISALGKYARAQEQHQEHFYRLHPRLVDLFRRELSRGAFTIIPVTDEEVEAAADLLRAHPEYAIGAADAIHLATALALRAQGDAEAPLVFVTADKALADAAREKGFTVFNPLYQGPQELEELIRRN